MTLEDLVSQIDCARQMAGAASSRGNRRRHRRPGGRECAPADVDDDQRYHKGSRTSCYAAAATAEADVENIMFRNWVRLFERTLPA